MTTRVRTVVIIVYDKEARGGDEAEGGARQQRGDGFKPRVEDKEEEEEEEAISSGSEVDSERD